MKIMFIGISNKPGLEPLDKSTQTGNIVHRIEEMLGKNYEFIHANLVPFAPTENGKLRYPTKTEIREAKPNLLQDIKNKCPDIIVLLGALVKTSLAEDIQQLNISVTWREHPSYICRFKRNVIDDYIKNIVDDIKERSNNE